MAAPRLTPRTYRALTLAALVSLVAIVITGALVRLTDSGLGCADWPNCNSEKFIDVSSSHAAIEQLNRLFTGVVGLAVILAVAGALIRRPRRRDLTWLSLSLVVGVLGQAIVGGIVVLTHLNPVAVQQHFLLSMVIIAAALVLYHRAALGDDERWVRDVPVPILRTVWVVATLAAAALVTGTVVTGTGPHSGQHEGDPVQRFEFAITTVARVHSITVLCFLAAALVLAWQLRRVQHPVKIENALSTVLFLGLVQGTVGYVQYFNDVPVALVGVHVALASGLWLAVMNLVVATRGIVGSGGPDAVAGTEPSELGAHLVEPGDGLPQDLAHGAH